MGKLISLQNVTILEPPACVGATRGGSSGSRESGSHYGGSLTCYPYTVGYHHISQQPHTIAYHINMTKDDQVTDLKLTFARKRQMGGEEGGYV
eukprot:scaffold84271_cov61-Attheya_sp.AAC.3